MGGGGGGPSRIGDIRSLIDTAKEKLRQGDGAGRKNVFISFANEDLDEVNLLRGQAKNESSPIDFNDWSVGEPFDSERAVYIKQKIGERISQSSLTVVYLSEATRKSQWVKWEIDESLRRGKSVIGVYKGDTRPSKLPDAVKKYRIKTVPWAQLAVEIAKMK